MLAWKAPVSNDDNSMLQMTALISVVSIVIIILFSKGPTKKPAESFISRSNNANPACFNIILLFFVVAVSTLDF